MMAKQMEAYQTNAINTASGPQLTLMLYNGCIKFIKQGMKSVQANDFEQKNINIQKAQNIIRELMLTLDQDIEISKQLMSLYDFIHFKLQEGNVKNNVAELEEALGFVTEIRDTWKEAMLSESSKYVQGAQV